MHYHTHLIQLYALLIITDFCFKDKWKKIICVLAIGMLRFCDKSQIMSSEVHCDLEVMQAEFILCD